MKSVAMLALVAMVGVVAVGCEKKPAANTTPVKPATPPATNTTPPATNTTPPATNTTPAPAH